jgi:hypothetical protein
MDANDQNIDQSSRKLSDKKTTIRLLARLSPRYQPGAGRLSCTLGRRQKKTKCAFNYFFLFLICYFDFILRSS